MESFDLAQLSERCFTQAPIGMAIVATDGRWLRVNNALCRMLGYSEEEFLAMDFQRITHPADADASIGGLTGLLGGKIPEFRVEKRYFHKSGLVVWVEVSTSLIRRYDGRPQCFIAHVNDISARKRVEAERDAFFKLSADIVGVLASDGRILKLNAAWTRLLGWSVEETKRHPFLHFVHPDDRTAVTMRIRDAFRGDGQGRCKTRCRGIDGQYRVIEWSSSIPSAGSLVYCIGRDMTEGPSST